MTVANNQHSVLLDNVYQLIGKKVAPASAELAEQFSRILFKNISHDDLEDRSDSDLYGATLSLWNEFVKFDSEKPDVLIH